VSNASNIMSLWGLHTQDLEMSINGLDSIRVFIRIEHEITPSRYFADCRPKWEEIPKWTF